MKNKPYIWISNIKMILVTLLISQAACNVFASHQETEEKKEEVVAKAHPAPTKIILASDYYCPYACEPGDSEEGMLVELAKKIFAKNSIEVQYKLMPWHDALAALENGEIDGVLGAKINEIKAVFPSVSQASSQTAAFVTSDSKWFYDGVNSISGNVIGLVDGYSYPLELKSYIYSFYITKPELFSFATGKNAVADNIQKLEKKQIWTYIEDENVVRYYMQKNNITNIKNVGYISPVPDQIFIAFSRASEYSDNYARFVSEAMVKMRESNELKDLYIKYNIKEY
ncbi:MAG: transporter substrate-binding domain-containing protein [Rickettsiaceae bacterium]|nr:transporter substrate-binding domain-containing protein [Rickettsiaceae bacterium]